MATQPANLRMSVHSGRFASIGAPISDGDEFLGQAAASEPPPRPGFFNKQTVPVQPAGALTAEPSAEPAAQTPAPAVNSPAPAVAPKAVKLTLEQRLQAATASSNKSHQALPLETGPELPGGHAAAKPAVGASSVRATPAQPDRNAKNVNSLTPPVAVEPSRPSAAERLHAAKMLEANTGQVRKEMATMKTLTRLLEAVFMRPGSLATESERMTALSTLLQKSQALGAVVARVAGEDYERSDYIKAMCMDAAVTLVCSAWEHGQDINWDKLISAAGESPEINQAAEQIARAVYRPVQTLEDASDRLALSMHGAFWQVIALGETVNGITPRLAAEIVRDCAAYLQAREKFVMDNDLYVSWLQGSIRRMTDLVCAETRARFADAENGPTQSDIEAILTVSYSGFEGVENYAQSILEKPKTNTVPRPSNS